MEVDEDEASSTIPKLEYNTDLVPTVDEEIVNLVNSFWHETEVLAHRHTHLQVQHSHLAAAQNAAIAEVKNTTESGVQQLAHHQAMTAVQFRDELDRTRTSMQAHLMELAAMQKQQGLEIYQSLNKQIVQAFAEVRAHATNAEAMASAQASTTQGLQATVESSINTVRSEFSRRLDSLPVNSDSHTVSPRLVSEMNQMVHQSVDERVRAAHTHHTHEDTDAMIELKLQRALERTFERQTQECAESAKRAVRDEVAGVEGRLEARMREALEKTSSDLHTLVDHQTNATMALSTNLSATQSLLHSLTSRVETLEGRDQRTQRALAPMPQVAIQSPPRPLPAAPQPARPPLVNRADVYQPPAPPVPPVPRSTPTAHPPSKSVHAALDNAVATAVERFQMAIQHHIQRGEQTLQLPERRMHARMRELIISRAGLDPARKVNSSNSHHRQRAETSSASCGTSCQATRTWIY